MTCEGMSLGDASSSVFSSNTLVENHVRTLGYTSLADFIGQQNPDGLLDSLPIPQMPTLRLVRADSQAHSEGLARRELVIGRVRVEGSVYLVVLVG